jgi:transglutaminase-like putative cysteine protease
MRLDLAFRLSTYLTLAVACLCLSYALVVFFPNIFLFTAAAGVLLGVAFRLEGRFALTNAMADLLAALIFGGALLWVYLHATYSKDTWLQNTPVPAAWLPYLGPVLMCLVVAKLLRPKHFGDYWALQAMGLLAVALGCAMAGDSLFGWLLLAYVCCAVWSLTTFYLQREATAARASASPPERPAADGAESVPGPAGPPVPWRWLGLGQAASWLAAVTVPALVAFLLTPRLANSSWELGLARQTQMETGMPDSGLDLNRTGTVGINNDLVLEVRAEDAERNPKTDLDPGIRWRGAVLNYYDQGRWSAQRPLSALTRPTDLTVPAAPVVLPDLGPRQYFLNVTVRTGAARGRIFLAEPVISRPGDGRLLVVSLQHGKAPTRWSEVREGAFMPDAVTRAGEQRYRQLMLPPDEPGLGPPVELDHLYQLYAEQLLREPLPAGLADWTSDVLRSLVARGELDPADLPAAGRLHPARWEAVGRALEKYLAASGGYTYGLQLRRQDEALDPVMDFLVNVKDGHCQRFATALALMLRSQDVPARVVAGYRGAEQRGDGLYEVRESQAHVWVEALITRRRPDGRPEYRWLTLDPTPGDAASPGGTESLARWWEDLSSFAADFWKTFVLDYNAEQQARAAGELRDRFAVGKLAVAVRWVADRAWTARTWGGRIALLAVVSVLAFGVWRVRRRGFPGRVRSSASAAAPTGLYARLVTVLARRCRLRPAVSETPREFAAQAGRLLEADPTLAAFAPVPGRVVELYYRVRYGGRPPAGAERREAESAVARLDATLAGRAAVETRPGAR